LKERNRLRVAVVGAGHWAEVAHLPAFRRCKEAEVVAVCDKNLDRAKSLSDEFHVPVVSDDFVSVIERDDVDCVDICASAVSHYPIALEAIKNRKAFLCEKPLASTYDQAKTLLERAAAANVPTKMGFTYRYSPALRRVKELIDSGFVGDPYLFNGFIQNSQFINPDTPFRWNPDPESGAIMTGSLEEYAPHLIDIALWLIGDVTEVIGHMQNSIPKRMIRDAGRPMRINIEDSAVFLGRFANQAVGTFQSSFVAIGNYPGMEVRIYGSKGAIVARMVEEFGKGETLRLAKTDDVVFRDSRIPRRFYPKGRSPPRNWVELYFGNLINTFVNELIQGREPEANLLAGAKAQEVEEAVYQSHLKRTWIKLPLSR
jgi:predicted dehydrogenase